ncbi:MAG TPA: hypothetical protein PLF22_09900 [Pseudomonadales bacterium]|nr:hypothetical protein [Pseudomonadales bacterium]
MTTPTPHPANRMLQDMEDLKASWENSPYPTVKVTSYFPAYAELFGHLRNTACTFIETGVLDGGSLFMWRSWLGDKARIIGIDLNPAAKKWSEHGFEIFIGDQGDPLFWQDTLAKIGQFDALLDDGGHQSFQQIVTSVEAIRHANQKCVIAVEDTTTSFMNDFSRHGANTFLEFSKDATDVLIGSSYDMFAGRFPPTPNQKAIDLFKYVYNIQFFNGIVAFRLDPALSAKPELVRNRPSNSASDFRYKGKNAAQVEWPHPFEARTVLVKGGTINRSRLRRFKASIGKIFGRSAS